MWTYPFHGGKDHSSAGASSLAEGPIDLNLPRKSRLEVLDEMRADGSLAHIPVIMLTSSSAQSDIEAAYAHGANAFVVKPQDLDSFMDLIDMIRGFWLGVARLPSG